MKRRGRQAIGLVAIYAIALHAILWGAGLSYGAAAVDPFTVICHSETGAADGQTPADPASVPSKSCDHCTLCVAMATPAPAGSAIVARLVPPKLLALLRPPEAAVPDAVSDNLNRARGPPTVA